MKLSWNGLWKALRSAIGWWALGTIALIVILSGYTAPWTGFGDYTTSTGDVVRGKTLWDWMELLIIPIFLAAGAIAVNRLEKQLEIQRAEERAKLEREIATDHQQEVTLQAYLDRMADLLLKEKLATTKKKEVRDIARTRTLSVIRSLDTRRKNLVIHFLREANLVNSQNTILKTANMEEMNLQGMDFYKVSLLDANLKKANLQGSYLEDSNLQEARLWEANLQDAILVHANLEHASLWKANLMRANLYGASLENANLLEATVTEAQLKEANSLKGATMPDGTKHD